MNARFDLSFTPNRSVSLVRQLMHQLIHEIQRGRLQKGEKLPGSRTLASQLGISRKTVETAYEELIVEGWLVSLARSGTFVSHHLPDFPVANGLEEASKNRYLEQANTRISYIDDGKPDLRLSPTRELLRAYKRSLTSRHHRFQPQVCGVDKARYIIGKFLSKARGLAVNQQHVMLTRGSQMALYLIAHTVFSPGDCIAVEEPGYPPTREVILQAGCQIVPVKVDQDGINIEELTRLTINGKIKGVFLTPHHHFPTTVTLPPERRLAIQQLSLRYGLFVVEDDYDFEYHFGIAPQMPISSIGYWERYAYIGSFSKILGSFVRLGFLITSPELINGASGLRSLMDGGGDPHLEFALCELMEERELARHIRRVRNVYLERRNTMVQLIKRYMPDWDFHIPTGGLALWMTNTKDKTMQTGAPSWVDQAFKQSDSYYLNLPHASKALRLGYGSMNSEEAQHCVSVLAHSLSNKMFT